MQALKKTTSPSTIRTDIGLHFSPSRVRRALAFVTRCYKADGVEVPRFQRRLIARLYGNVNPKTGYRRYRRVYYSTPRKNAKSTLAAALALFHLFADGERSPRIFLAATTLEQAAETFEIITRMCAAIPALDRQTRVLDSSNRKVVYRIVDGRVRGYIKALTSRGSKEGKNPSLVISDEFCDWRELHRPLYKSMTMGSFARKQPIFLYTTTAGDDESVLCKEMYAYAKRVLSGEKSDLSFLPYIFEVDPQLWMDKAEQIRANPLVSEGFIDEAAIDAEFADAEISPAELAKFQNKRLNMWVGSSVGFLPMDKWREQGRRVEDVDLIGLPCMAGLDLARSNDFNALVLLFEHPDCYFVKAFFWLPEFNLKTRIKTDGKPYDLWEKRGLLELCRKGPAKLRDGTEYERTGAVVDHHLILEKLRELRETYSIREIAFDRWGAEYLVADLEREGFTVAPHGQGYKDMSSPMNELLSLVLQGKLVHGGNEILDWMAGNLSAKEDETGNRKPHKATRATKIDGMAALLMALGVTLRNRTGRYESALAKMFPTTGEAA